MYFFYLIENTLVIDNFFWKQQKNIKICNFVFFVAKSKQLIMASF